MNSRPSGRILLILVCTQFINTIVITLIDASYALSSPQKANLRHADSTNAQIVSNQELTQKTDQLTPAQQQALLRANKEAHQHLLTVIYYALGVIGIIGLVETPCVPHRTIRESMAMSVNVAIA